MLLTLSAVLPAVLRMPLQVRSNSLWAAYELKGDGLGLRLPRGASVAPVRLFRDSPPRKMLLFNEYECASPYFSGRRLEINVIVRSRNRARLHFVVMDCVTDVLHWDPEGGVQVANCARYSRHTRDDTTLRTRIRTRNGKRFEVSGRIDTKDLAITREFAVDPNWQCFFRDHAPPLDLDFDPVQLTRPVRALKNATVVNDLWEEARGELLCCFVHPHAMDFVVDVADRDKWVSV